MKIRAYTNYSESNNTHYYRDCTIINELPDIKNIEELKADTTLINESLYNDIVIDIDKMGLDYEQPSNDVYNYDFYRLTIVDIADYHNEENEDKDIKDYIKYDFVAILKNLDTE